MRMQLYSKICSDAILSPRAGMTLLAIPTGLLLLTPICSNARADDSFVDPHRKAVGLTLRRELVEQAPAAEIAGALPLVGTLFPEATVARIDGSTGMLLNLGAPEGADAAAVGPIGYVHVSNASDKYVERLDKEFKAGQVVTGRVIAQRSADGLVSVSLKEGVVTQAKLGIRDCVAGESLEGKVESVTERGVVVRITDAITGFCPRLHCSDAPNELSQTAMAKKFAEGAKLKWRVLVADAAKNKLIVTARRSLLASKAEPLAQLDDAQEGAKYAGVVANVQSFGVFIEFFGNVRGLAHRSQLGLLPSQEPSEVFERGAPVRATVLSVDMRKRQLSLSLVASKKAANASAEAAAGLESFEQGDVVQAVVRSAASKSSTLTLAVDICAEDADPAAEGAVTARAILPCGHLSEAEDVSAGALELFREGDELGFPCVVLDKDSGKGLLRVSAKPSLVAAARRGELPYTTDDVRPGDLLDGYVASVTPTAVFVRCGDRCTGYVPSSRAMERQAPDAPRLSLTGLYARDQSVLVRVAEVDAGANKFTGSLLPSAVAAEASRAAHGVASSVAWMRRGAALALRVKEEGLRGAKVQLSETEKLEERWCARFPLGKRFSGEVVEEMEQGVVVKVDAAKEVLFFLSADATGGVEAPAKGEEVELRVIDANVAEGIVDVTSAAVAMPDEPAAGKKKASKKKGAVKVRNSHRRPHRRATAHTKPNNSEPNWTNSERTKIEKTINAQGGSPVARRRVFGRNWHTNNPPHTDQTQPDGMQAWHTLLCRAALISAARWRTFMHISLTPCTFPLFFVRVRWYPWPRSWRPQSWWRASTSPCCGCPARRRRSRGLPRRTPTRSSRLRRSCRATVFAASSPNWPAPTAATGRSLCCCPTRVPRQRRAPGARGGRRLPGRLSRPATRWRRQWSRARAFGWRYRCQTASPGVATFPTCHHRRSSPRSSAARGGTPRLRRVLWARWRRAPHSR